MNEINTVLFDFDGTIMNTNDAIIQSWQHTFKTVEGKERPIDEIVKTFGEPLTITMEKMLPQIPVEDGIAIYRSFHYERFSDLITVFPGVTELLVDLKDKNYKIGLVTSRLWRTTKIGLDKYDMTRYFDTIVTSDDTRKYKPDPEPVNTALKRLDTKPPEAIMLGDSMFDILSARNAGVRVALVGWALAVSEEEKSGLYAPDHILDRADDLFKIIR